MPANRLGFGVARQPKMCRQRGIRRKIVDAMVHEQLRWRAGTSEARRADLVEELGRIRRLHGLSAVVRDTGLTARRQIRREKVTRLRQYVDV